MDLNKTYLIKLCYIWLKTIGSIIKLLYATKNNQSYYRFIYTTLLNYSGINMLHADIKII